MILIICLITLAALLIPLAIIFDSNNDPLKKCVDSLIESAQIKGSKKNIKAIILYNETGEYIS